MTTPPAAAPAIPAGPGMMMVQWLIVTALFRGGRRMLTKLKADGSQPFGYSCSCGYVKERDWNTHTIRMPEITLLVRKNSIHPFTDSITIIIASRKARNA